MAMQHSECRQPRGFELPAGIHASTCAASTPLQHACSNSHASLAADARVTHNCRQLYDWLDGYVILASQTTVPKGVGGHLHGVPLGSARQRSSASCMRPAFRQLQLAALLAALVSFPALAVTWRVVRRTASPPDGEHLKRSRVVDWTQLEGSGQRGRRLGASLGREPQGSPLTGSLHPTGKTCTAPCRLR